MSDEELKKVANEVRKGIVTGVDRSVLPTS